MQPSEMKSLFLAWQAPTRRAWFPIGLLNSDREHSRYVFQYTQGALRAKREAGFQPLPAFPDFDRRYEASELFPLFKNRVIGSHRRDFSDYLRSLDIDPTNPDPIEILGVSGGERQTDSFEVFPKIEKEADNSFRCRFFLHGLRYVAEAGQRRGLQLQSDELLQVSLELNNPVTGSAIQLTTQDYMFLGWAPRYLVVDILKAIAESPALIAKVMRVNDSHVPENRRILIELTGHLPESVTPMSESDFQIVPSA